jgi:hypothetical protein
VPGGSSVISSTDQDRLSGHNTAARSRIDAPFGERPLRGPTGDIVSYSS